MRLSLMNGSAHRTTWPFPRLAVFAALCWDLRSENPAPALAKFKFVQRMRQENSL